MRPSGLSAIAARLFAGPTFAGLFGARRPPATMLNCATPAFELPVTVVYTLGLPAPAPVGAASATAPASTNRSRAGGLADGRE